MAVTGDIKVRELSLVSSIKSTDYLIVELEDGTKRATIATLQKLIAKTQYFDNVQEMINTNTLKIGDICMTHGYYEPGDGGGAIYMIDTLDDTIVDNKADFDIFTGDDSGLVAKIILDENVTIEQFGAKGDGITDDILSFKSALNKCNGKIVNCKHNSIYYITDSILVDGTVNFSFNNCTLKPDTLSALKISSVLKPFHFDKVQIDCSEFGIGVEVEGDCLGSTIDTITVLDVDPNRNAITFKNIDNLVVDRIITKSDNSSGKGINIINTHSNPETLVINSIIFNNSITPIYIDKQCNNTFNLIINHITAKTTLNNNVLFVNYGSPIIYIKECIASGFSKLFACNTGSYDIAIDNLTCYNTNTCAILDNLSEDGIVSFNGKLRFFNTNTAIDSMIWVNKNYGKIYINTLDIKKSGNFLDSFSLTDYNGSYPGKIITQGIDYTNELKVYEGNNGILENNAITNIVVDWATNTDLTNINNINEGQIFYIKSSTGMRISTLNDNTNIILKSEVTKNLSLYNGVTLRITNGKAVEV